MLQVYDNVLRDWTKKYEINVVYGRPGSGKTTFAFNALARFVQQKYGVRDWDEARWYVYTNYFYMPSSVADFIAYIKKLIVDRETVDWLFLDDAAIHYHADPKLFYNVTEALKMARGAIAKYGTVITTFNQRYLAKKVAESSSLYYVKRDDFGGYVYIFSFETRYKITNIELAKTPKGSPVERTTRARLVAEIPLSPVHALPQDLERELMEVRWRKLEEIVQDAELKLSKRLGVDEAEELDKYS